MRTNEEIVKKHFPLEANKGVIQKGIVNSVKICMNLARADEKKKSNSGNFSVKGNYTFNQLINRYDTLAKELNKRLRISYSQGFDKGCLETKEKMLNEIREIHQLGDDNLLRWVRDQMNLKELSCPEMEVTRVASGYNITPKDNQSHQNKGLNTSKHSARSDEGIDTTNRSSGSGDSRKGLDT